VLAEHVLVVDDESRYLTMIRFNLETLGYRVTCVETGEEALRVFAEDEPDLIMLDLMLPGLDGFELCRRVREESTCPIIMLTAKGADEDKVRGLRLGADDYVTKPFSVQELMARIEAVLRRSRPVESPEGQPHALSFGELQIDFPRKQVTVAGADVRLSPTEYRLLCCLAASAGTVLSRHELLTQVWGDAYRTEDEILRVTLWRLRHKLTDDPSNPRFIITRPGIGYMLVAPDQPSA
jgi:two-component system response regulator VicR